MSGIELSKSLSPQDEAAIEKMWEMDNLYDRYEIDSTILNAASDITSLRNHRLVVIGTRYWSSERREAAEEAAELLDARYEEIVTELGEDKNTKHPYSYFPLSNYVYHKLLRVTEQWKTHYFLPRTELVGLEHYNSWQRPDF